MFRFVRVRNFFSQLKLNKKFLFMYIFGVILPLIITDAVLFRSVFEAELDNQRKYREDATNAYVNRIQDILSFEAGRGVEIEHLHRVCRYLDFVFSKFCLIGLFGFIVTLRTNDSALFRSQSC